MTKALVGYTGFVGSNLDASARFEGRYNSGNIGEAYGTKPDLLVYSGLRAEKFLANADPGADLAAVRQAEESIERIGAGTVVLISTVDVYPEPRGVDELSEIDASRLEPYGADRLELERWVEAACPRHLIVRLPALFGRNLKKNFIYDLLHPVPRTLSAGLYRELSSGEPAIAVSYHDNGRGFFDRGEGVDEDALAEAFARAGFDTARFTDSRSRFQFLDLSGLWGYIERALELGIERLNMATEPVSAREVYALAREGSFENELPRPPFDYDFRSVHAAGLGGSDGYLYGRDEVLRRLAAFLGGGRR